MVEYLRFLAFVAVTLGLANIVMLAGLLRIYVNSYRQVRANYTRGLIIFSTLFLLETFLFTFFSLRQAVEASGMLMIITLLSIRFGGIFILFKQTLE